MLPLRHVLLVTIALMCAACEGPPRPPSEDPLSKLINPPESGQAVRRPPPKPKPAVPPPEPTTAIANSRQIIDGRTNVPLPAAATQEPLTSLRTYDFGTTPPPLQPEARQHVVEPVGTPLSAPVVQEVIKGGRLVMTPHRKGWEAPLLAAGLQVLDRSRLPALEFETFLQHAKLSAASAAKPAIAAQASDKPGEGSPPVAAGPRLIGRFDYNSPTGDRVHWYQEGEFLLPMLNGSKNSPAERIEQGRVLAAQYLLELSEPRFWSVPVRLAATRPTAASVPHEAVVAGTIQLPKFEAGTWAPIKGDPFQAELLGGTTFFDPEQQALWRVERAWVGRQVPQSDFLANRRQFIDTVCPECQTRQRKEVTKPPTADLVDPNPAHWKCPECSAEGDVRYLDGYRVDDKPISTSETILAWKWIEPTAGVYPVLQLKSLASGGSHLIRFSSASSDDNPLATGGDPCVAEAAKNPAFCWIDDAKRGLLLPAEQLLLLQSHPHSGSVSPGHLRLPLVDGDGRQRFELAGPLHTACSADLPCRFAEVEVRLLRVQDARVLAAGSLALSFFHVMPDAVKLPVFVEGIDLTTWPSEQAQDHQLLQELHKRVAAAIAGR